MSARVSLYLSLKNTSFFTGTVKYCRGRRNLNGLGLLSFDVPSCRVLASSHRFTSTNSPADSSEWGRVIYTGPLAQRIKSVKRFSLMTSFCGLMMQPILLQKFLESQTGLGIVIFAGTFIQFFTFATPFLIHFVTKKYVRALYYDESKDIYTALMYNFWSADKMIKFKVEDVEVPDVPGMFTSILVKGIPLFIEADVCDDIQHYKRIMGYDKPIDFKLEKPPKP